AIVGPQYVDIVAARVSAPNRLLRYCERVDVDALLDVDADIHSRQKLASLIREFSAQRDLIGGFVHARVRENQLSWVRIDGSLVEYEPHLGGIRRDLVDCAAFEIAPQLLKLAHRLDEIRINGIELLDSREMG